MWNRFAAVDQRDDFMDVYKLAPSTNFTDIIDNSQLIHGLSLMCVIDAVGLGCLMMD